MVKRLKDYAFDLKKKRSRVQERVLEKYENGLSIL